MRHSSRRVYFLSRLLPVRLDTRTCTEEEVDSRCLLATTGGCSS